MLPSLNRSILLSGQCRVEHTAPPTGPINILQIGEGNFLRGFVDWMIDIANAQGKFSGCVAVAQPRPHGKAEQLNTQDGLYTVVLRGSENGQAVDNQRVVSCIREGINPYTRWSRMLELAHSAELRFVVSNTTEAGIADVDEAYHPGQTPASFPAQVTALLHARYQRLGGSEAPGLVFLPCELIEANGSKLREIVLRHAQRWNLGADFAHWVASRNHFLNTLVDRIVPGYPAAQADALFERLGYTDALLVAAEPFHLWVIEGPASIAQEFPLQQAGLNLIWTDDLQPYRTRKVRILNGAHTASALAAYGSGLDTVTDMVRDPLLARYLEQLMFEEIVPLVPLPEAERTQYAHAVMERFGNTFIRHELISITLNSVSKWKVRVLPTVKDYVSQHGRAPKHLAFSLAALLHFYHGQRNDQGSLIGQRFGQPYPIQDDAAVLAILEAAWQAFDPQQAGRMIQSVLADTRLWGEDLTLLADLSAQVTLQLTRLESKGTRPAMTELLNHDLPLPTPDVIRLHADDDVVIACKQLISGAWLATENLAVKGLIPPGHKIASRALAQGEAVRRYNQVIGFAKQDIAAGEHVHTHNLGMGGEFARDYAFCQARKDPPPVATPATFEGFVRANGKVGTRNYLAVIASVNCSATVVRKIADHFNHGDALKPYPHIDGIVPIVHQTGCGMNSNGLDMVLLRRTIQGFATHPNFAGVLLVGLGCEMNQVGPLVEALGGPDQAALKSLVIQQAGGTSAAIRQGIEALASMLPAADQARRSRVPLSQLIIGLNCGGSDGYSGITANPALGGMVDLLVAHGGTAILSETPEVYGAEHLLTRRAETPEIGQKLIGIIDWWRDYTSRNGGEMDNNPSVGNKAGGLTTILEKSLGAVAKGGTTTLKAVYGYAEPVTAKGFVFMDTPGYDPVSATGQAAGGAQLICFTTGRGSAFGCAGVPTIKFATNNALWERQRDDMDVNCGDIITGAETMAHLSQRMFQELIDYASGRRTRSELLGYGQDEFIPWKVGAVM